MNNIMRKQLEYLKLPLDQDTFYFPKRQEIKLVEDNYYLIRLKEEVLHPNPNSAYVVNWNQGSIPSNEYYQVDVVKILNDMIKVTGVAWDPQTQSDSGSMWTGWIPVTGIEILRRL